MPLVEPFVMLDFFKKVKSIPMDTVAEKLNLKLKEWKPDIAHLVKQRVVELIDLADHNALDVSRSRTIEQQVLDILDEPTSR